MQLLILSFKHKILLLNSGLGSFSTRVPKGFQKAPRLPESSQRILTRFLIGSQKGPRIPEDYKKASQKLEKGSQNVSNRFPESFQKASRKLPESFQKFLDSFHEGCQKARKLLEAFWKAALCGGTTCFGSCFLSTLERHSLFWKLLFEHFRAAQLILEAAF